MPLQFRRFPPQAAVTVDAPARLHLGFLDPNATLGRAFGSLGLFVDGPGTRLVARRAERQRIDGALGEADRARVAQWLDVLHRAHAGVEDRVRTNKALGLGKLPSKSWEVNCGWVLAANLAADLDAWTRLLGLHDSDDLADAEPGTLRYRLLHLPGRLTRHARTRTLAIAADWPWAKAFTTCWDRLTSLPAPT